MAQSSFQVILKVEYRNYDDKLVLQTVFCNDSLGQMFNQMTILTFCVGILQGTCLQGLSQIGSSKEILASMLVFFLISVYKLWFLRFLFVIYFLFTELQLLNVLSINSPLKDKNNHQLQFTFIGTISTQKLNHEPEQSQPKNLIMNFRFPLSYNRCVSVGLIICPSLWRAILMRSFRIVFSTACMNDQTISKVSFSYCPRKERRNTVTKMKI